MSTMLQKNRPWDTLQVGDTAELRRLCVADDLYVFAHASGNRNPMHLPHHDGDADGTPEAIAPGMWVAAQISAVLGNQLPGPGTLYRSQTLRFIDRAIAGDELVTRVRLTEKRDGRIAIFETSVETADGRRLCEGVAEVIAPDKPMTFDVADVPGLTVQSHEHFAHLLAKAEPLPPIVTAVVAPEDESSLAGALLAAQHTLITPMLVGDVAKMQTIAAAAGLSLDGIEMLDVSDHSNAARAAVQLVRDGGARALMKGHLHTDTLLKAVLKREKGLRTARRLSHVFVMDVPGLEHLLFVTDAAINIAPDLETKVDIVQNAIDLARGIGVDTPKVGILSAVETVTPSIPSTLDAAILSKMAERGQITGGLVDGPLAMDNAMDLEAARTKGIKSMVAGRADILVVPNLEAGNMLAKELTFVTHAEAGGVVMGAQCPIILTSRADGERARLASCAIAALYDAWSTGADGSASS
jgi:phosphotransacetylase/acyl dehydratase